MYNNHHVQYCSSLQRVIWCPLVVKRHFRTTKTYFSYLSLEFCQSSAWCMGAASYVQRFIYLYINNNDIAVSTNFHLKILYTFYNL